jgi:PAT family beta-lactamase induction signal transducer AmpG
MVKAPGGGWRSLGDRRIALMLALGFSSGLPLLLVLGTFSARLAFSDIDVKTIGLFSYLALPYSLKFLWSPIVDRYDLPVLARLLGRRRAWMVLSQLCVAASLTLMAFAEPAGQLALLGLGAFLVAFSAATQDVVIDGWRIDAAGTEMQGIMAATSNLGYRIALITAGAGALVLADRAGWTAAYLSMAALMGVGMLAALAAPVIDRKAPEPRGADGPATARPALPLASRARALVDPVADLHRRLGPRLWAILLMVALYRMPDFVSGVMANPLYRAAGYSLTEIAAVTKLYGIWVGIFASFVAGWGIARFGLYPVFVVGGALAASVHLSLAWLALHGPDSLIFALPWPPAATGWAEFTVPWRLALAISIDNFGGGFAGTALIAYMSGLTGAGFAASQYALLSSLYALPGKLVAGSAGFLVAAFAGPGRPLAEGFPGFFALTAAMGIPVVLLCLTAGRIVPKKAAEPETQPAPAPAATVAKAEAKPA